MADETVTKYTDKPMAERIAENPEWAKDISARKTAAEKTAAAVKRAEDAEAKLADAETVKTAAEAAAETKRLEDSGEYDKSLENQKASMQAITDAAVKRGDGYKARLTNLVGNQALTMALGAAGVPSDRLAQAAQLLDSRVRVEFDADGKESVTAMDEELVPMFVDGKPATLEDLAKSFTANNAFFMPPSNDNGSGKHPGGAGDSNAGLTQQALLANPARHAEFIESFATTEESRVAFGKLPPK